MTVKIIKSILAILFFICLVDLPYGYYQFVRFAALVGFAFLSYQSYEREMTSHLLSFFVRLQFYFNR